MKRKWVKTAVLALAFIPLVFAFLCSDGPYTSPIFQFFFENSGIIVLLYSLVWLIIACRKFPMLNEECVGFAVVLAFLILLSKLGRRTLIDSVDSIIENSTLFLLMLSGLVRMTENKPKN